MAKVNLEELLGGLQEASQVVLSIQERQHINTISKYFDKDGTPITQKLRIGDRDIEIPLYILADHSSVGLDKLDIEFQARLLPGNTTKPSALKKNLLPIFQRQKQKGNNKYKHQISNISVDGNSPDKEGVAKISIHFKKDNKPEAVSRLVDMLIAKMDDPTHKVIENGDS
jgi:hypothetical protein|tara:strand:- start:861 stop:1370 length:510 start_codon:yes stop_codon:yes gene_type:complete